MALSAAAAARISSAAFASTSAQACPADTFQCHASPLPRARRGAVSPPIFLGQISHLKHTAKVGQSVGRRGCSATRGAVAPVAPPVAGGFSQIGEPVPDGISMSDVLKTLPKEVFEIDEWKSWRAVAITLPAVALGYAALAVAPWYMLPAVYAYMSAAVTGLFVIGHDAGHNCFSKNQLVNDIVGTLVFAPLIYPFEPWRIKHNTHHAHTNKLKIDTAWQPFTPPQFDQGGPVAKALIKASMGPLWWLASVGHWLFWHFDVSKYRLGEQGKVKISLAAVAAFTAGVLLPLLITQGPIAFAKWWLLPWLGFHFWMSTFTLVHHTAPHIPFKHAREWDQVKAQLGGTVHCEYPAWIELLCHDISVHIPHHLSTKIPHYNLRKAYAAIEEHWGKYTNKAEFGVPLMKTVLQCNLFDHDKKAWVSFDPLARSQA